MKRLPRGPGKLADPNLPAEKWGGRKAIEFVKLTLQRYGRVCWLCGLPGSTSADHIIPRSKGGAVYDLANLGPTHKRCNESRGNRDATGPEDVIENGLAYFTKGAAA